MSNQGADDYRSLTQGMSEQERIEFASLVEQSVKSAREQVLEKRKGANEQVLMQAYQDEVSKLGRGSKNLRERIRIQDKYRKLGLEI